MNAVVPHAPANHVDDVARNGGFDVGRSSVGQSAGHDAHRSTVHEGFADVSVVKHDGSVHRGYTRFIAANTNA